jgi:hypothetical protein
MTALPQKVLSVTSHVARDLLQSAATFEHPHKVVWEYVSNGLDYVDPGTRPHVKVEIQTSPKRIAIRDNGRGMLMEDLDRFFTMHGENIDRKRGRPGRGRFGTGKSAAFAIAEVLRLRTVRNNRRSVVELHRSDLEDAQNGAPVPVRVIENELRTTEPNGTTVEIEKIKQPIKLNKGEIVKQLERHIAHWRDATVEVNGQKVEYVPPPYNEIYEYIAGESEHPAIRGAKLTVKAAKSPLAAEDRGIEILSNGVLHEVTLAGSETKEIAQYIFGEVDVPALSTPFEGIDAYDMTRSGRLNVQNPVVQATLSFVFRCVEEVREGLVAASRKRKAEAEARKLQRQADEIARIINQDYAAFRSRFKPTSATKTGGDDTTLLPAISSGEELTIRPGGEEPARTVGHEGGRSGGEGGGGNGGGGGRPVVEPASGDADAKGHSKPSNRTVKKNAGGFDVKFEHMGEEENRAKYDRTSRTIYINIDHPQLIAARGNGEIEDPNFRRLSFEVAFTEYAIGLETENVAENWYIDFGEPLTAMRSTIDRVSRAAAALFSPDGPTSTNTSQS